MTNNRFTRSTPILDYHHPIFDDLFHKRALGQLDSYEKIGAIYTFVKDEVVFGYNTADDLPASQVLMDGYGQCNTKSTLFMALLRRVGIACRFHGFTIYNELQKGAIPPWLFFLAPRTIIHSWVEVYHNEKWLNLEGLILDAAYLKAVQNRFCNSEGAFSGFGISTTDLANPKVTWQGQSTYIQREGIAEDFGIYDDPDAFYAKYGTNLTGVKKWLYAHAIRHLMNRNVSRIRKGFNRPRPSLAEGNEAGICSRKTRELKIS